jgi:hypothetical protein
MAPGLIAWQLKEQIDLGSGCSSVKVGSHSLLRDG